jgi:membrane protein insertase Oxa1/YidC/SpoIIIJ
MTKVRIALYSIFALYHLISFGFTAYIDLNKNDWSLLTKMLGKISLFKYGTLIGFLLIIVDILLSYQASKKSTDTITDLQNEVNALKAKAYDQQAKS